MTTRLQRLRRDDERGFALVFVLFVTTVVMMAVTTTLVATTPNIAAAKQTQDVAGALVAAQSGIDDAVAYLISVPECRSQTRICPKALGASTTALAAAGSPRPTSLSPRQTFSWFTGNAVTAEGYVRVSSTGTADGVSRRLVADLSLAPSILSYGYYTDYESQSPKFVTDYYGPSNGASTRNVYLSDATTFSKINSSYQNGKSVPQTVKWVAPAGTGNCGQHWYKESSTVLGRGYQATSTTTPYSVWTQSGSIVDPSSGSTTSTVPATAKSCDLVFTSGMTEDGKTYSRDAFDVSYATGNGPIFQQPVYTLWGYTDGRENFTSPAFTGGQPWRGDTLGSASTYKPVVAPYDLTLPTSIGTDGLADNSCVYFGPTRVVLNGDGTATITSPETTSVNPASDPRCYPSSLPSTGIVSFRMNYTVAGSGTLYVKNLGTAPSGGWPDNGTKATQTPSASNEVFWFPSSGVATADASTSTAPSSACTSSTKYAATAGAACAWTNVATATDATSSTGWSAYTTATKCNGSPPATDEQLFQCEYSQLTTSTTPTVDGYAAVRAATQSLLSDGTCVSGTASVQAGCLQGQLNTLLARANTGQHAYSYSSPGNGDRRYSATSTAGSTSQGSTRTPPAVAPDSLNGFTASTNTAKETPSRTPITTTVYRQVYNSSNRTWSAGTPQFTFTTTHTDWAVTTQGQISGTSFFPRVSDVTDYNSGTTAGAPTVPSGSSGSLQPGDLYVQGQNNGRLSLVAQNDIVVTGDITDTGTTGSDTQAVDLVAGNDVRNYHPLSCVDQDATDINATSPGWCPNDITNLTSSPPKNADGTYSAQAPQLQYQDLAATGDHTIHAAVFTLSGSFRTDNFDRGPWVGNVNVYGGIYQSHRGGNGTNSTSSGVTVNTGLTLNYHYVDLERANLPYAPPASNSANPRPWNVVSVSAGP